MDAVQTPFVYSTVRGVGSSGSKHPPQVELRGGSTSGGCLLPELHIPPRALLSVKTDLIYYDLIFFP
jgi:hypothetical protein